MGGEEEAGQGEGRERANRRNKTCALWFPLGLKNVDSRRVENKNWPLTAVILPCHLSLLPLPS